MTVGGHVTLDAKLSVNTAVTEVEVQASGGAMVNTQTQELSQVVDTQQLASLPSLTRNPYDFVAISGNISNGDCVQLGQLDAAMTNTNCQNSSMRGVGFNINGQRSSGTEILLDGVENIQVFTRRNRDIRAAGFGAGVSRLDKQLRGSVRARIGRRCER